MSGTQANGNNTRNGGNLSPRKSRFSYTFTAPDSLTALPANLAYSTCLHHQKPCPHEKRRPFIFLQAATVMYKVVAHPPCTTLRPPVTALQVFWGTSLCGGCQSSGSHPGKNAFRRLPPSPSPSFSKTTFSICRILSDDTPYFSLMRSKVHGSSSIKP